MPVLLYYGNEYFLYTIFNLLFIKPISYFMEVNEENSLIEDILFKLARISFFFIVM